MTSAYLAAFALFVSLPAAAQTVISNHPPLSPEDAVRVLRGSHSIADLTDYHSPGTGPTIVVMGDSTTPWDWPMAAFSAVERYAPVAPLWPDSTLWLTRSRRSFTPRHLGSPASPAHSVPTTPAARLERPPRPAPRDIAIPAASSAGSVRRR
jgi:hypothetical protein